MERIKLWETDSPYFNEELQTEANEGTSTITPYIINDGKKHKAIIICPGGGYKHRAVHEGEGTALWLNERGINAFVVDYKVFPYRHPVPFADVKRAVRYVRHFADKFNVDKDGIGIMGFSAGAHVACCVTEYYDKFETDVLDDIDSESARPDICVLCYPVISLNSEYCHEGSKERLTDNDEELSRILSCEEHVRDDMPPVFMWHTVEDKSVPLRNSLEMAKALKEKNIPFEYHVFPYGRHGSSIVKCKDIEGTKNWPELFYSWLKRQGFGI